MPKIRPISDLRNNYNYISEICHTENEPVFLTKNGVGDLVVMSMDYYEKLDQEYRIYLKLLEAEERSKTEKSYTHDEFMKLIRENFPE